MNNISKDILDQVNQAINQSAELAEQLQSDIRLASTRIEHIRVTARANEAVHLLHELQKLGEILEQQQQLPTAAEEASS